MMLPMYLLIKSCPLMLSSVDVDQEPAGPQVHLMSMSQTTEPSNDGPTVSEGVTHHFLK